MFDPQRCCAIQEVVEHGDSDEDVCCRPALEVELLALLVSRRVHGRWEVDHPRKDRLDERVVQQVHRETDTTEEVEDWRGKDLASPGGEKDAEEYHGCTEVIPVAADVRFITRNAVHDLLHNMRPMGVLRVVLWVASEEHAKNNHHSGYRRGEDGGCGVFVVVVEFGDEHACDDVQTLEGSNCETC